MTSLIGFFRAKENDEYESEHVERGENGDKPTNAEQRVTCGSFLRDSLREDCVLAEESAQRPHAGQRECADEECPEGHGHFLAERAHLPDVLLMLHGMNHRACAEEQERLEERVRGEMEHRGGRAAEADSHYHV